MNTIYTLISVFVLTATNWGFSQTIQDTTFEYCPEMNTWPYYRYPDLNERSFREIKNHFREDYSALNPSALANNSGIITIQFKINCQGDVGKFSLATCDLTYVKNEINPMITDFFMEKVKSMGGWKEAIDDDGNSGNAHKFYSFRIVNGTITEILPK
ncbi:MAG: hypothetical protein COA38_10730 [Fluviicola sp.]|nr:MAG: hypothetical protein COA38_10730 [Fluviicola sp.]